MNSTLVLTASTSEATSRKFPAQKSFKCFIQNSRHLVLKEIPISAWPTHCSNSYNLFQSSSFNETGFKFQDTSFIFLRDKILSQDPSVTLQEYFQYFFPIVFQHSVSLILNAVPLAVLSLIFSVYITVQTVQVVIIPSLFVLN